MRNDENIITERGANANAKKERTAGGGNGCLFFVLCALILVIVGRRANAQPFKPPFTDTVQKTDTVYKGVPLYQSFDTTAMVYVTRSNRPVLKPCFVVRSGFKQQGPKGLQWVEEPQITAIYSKRWKKIDGKKIGRLL